MSNLEKTKIDTEEDVTENSDDSDYLSSEKELGQVRELIFALPALRVSESFNVYHQAIREKAIAAAQLVIAVAEEVGVQKTVGEKSGTNCENIVKRKLGRPKKVKLDVPVAEGVLVKKPRKKCTTQLNNPPKGPPKCNVCGRVFSSWKAVFGHLRSHKDRGYQGFFPPPAFNAAGEGFGRVVGSSCGGEVFGCLGTRGLNIDLNVEPVEEEEGSGSSPKFDLNKSPPKEEEDI